MRYRTLALTTPGLALILSLAACGSDDAPAGPSKVAPTHTSPETLTVQVKADKDAAPTTWTLTCDPVGGDHPAGQKACAALKAAPEALKTPPTGQMCTTIYGGPETATLTGTWQGAPIKADFKRTDGCAMTRWDKLAPVFTPR